MKVNNQIGQPVDPYRTQLESTGKDVQVQRSRQGEVNAARQGDRISLSPAALLHTEAHAAITGAPEIRQEKVDAIKEKVAAGEYNIDARKIAKKIIQTDAFLVDSLKE